MVNEFAKNRWAVVGFDYDMAKALITAIEWSAIDKDILRRVRVKMNCLLSLLMALC